MDHSGRSESDPPCACRSGRAEKAWFRSSSVDCLDQKVALTFPIRRAICRRCSTKLTILRSSWQGFDRYTDRAFLVGRYCGYIEFGNETGTMVFTMLDALRVFPGCRGLMMRASVSSKTHAFDIIHHRQASLSFLPINNRPLNYSCISP